MIESIYWTSLIVYAAAVEYGSHRWWMHKPGGLYWMYENHAILHHAGSRNDVNVDMPVWVPLVGVSPYLVLAGVFAAWHPRLWITLSLTIVAAWLYSYAWTHIHRGAHDLESHWLHRLPLYNVIREHHLAHHRQPNANFGAIFWFSDRVFGTRAKREVMA